MLHILETSPATGFEWFPFYFFRELQFDTVLRYKFKKSREAHYKCFQRSRRHKVRHFVATTIQMLQKRCLPAPMEFAQTLPNPAPHADT